MYKFTKELQLDDDNDDDNECKNILIISFKSKFNELESNLNKIQQLKNYLEMIDPTAKLIGIQLISNLNNLYYTHKQYISTVDALNYSKNQPNSLLIRKYPPKCWYCIPKRLNYELIDAVEFYSEERDNLKKEILDQMNEISAGPIENLFVQFETKEMAFRLNIKFN